MTVFIISCATVVVVSFLCSLMEAVLLSLNPLQLRRGAYYVSVDHGAVLGVIVPAEDAAKRNQGSGWR